MYCPACDEFIFIEDLEDTEPFDCPKCHTLIEMVIDEGTYQGAIQRHLQIVDD